MCDNHKVQTYPGSDDSKKAILMGESITAKLAVLVCICFMKELHLEVPMEYRIMSLEAVEGNEYGREASHTLQ